MKKTESASSLLIQIKSVSQECRTSRNRFAILFATLLLASPVFDAQARSLVEIKKTKELRVCLYATNPARASAEPADCRDNCKFSGPVYEQVMAFKQYLGHSIRVKMLSVNFNEQFFNQDGKTVREDTYTPNLLSTGQCDLYPGNLTKNEWRLKKLDFVTVTPNRMMVIVRKSEISRYKTAADLAGKLAAVRKDTSYHQWLQEQNQSAYATNPVRIELTANSEASLAAVDTGLADFTLADSDSAIWAVRHTLKNARVVFPVGPVDEIGWAFRKDDKDLQIAVQSFFDQQRKSETSALNQIWKKHFGVNLNKFVSLVKSTE